MAGLITFSFGPIGRWLVIGLAFLAWTAYQRNQAADRARSECQAEQLQKTIIEITRQREAAKAALKAAESLAEITRVELEALERARDEIVAELDASKDDLCVIGDDLRKRLSDIK